MLRLAGREADGAILNWLAATDVAHCKAEVGTDKMIAAPLFVIPNADADVARFIARRMISSYLTVNAYAEFHRWLGRGDALTPMWDAWAAGNRKLANEVIPDSVVDELVIHGSYEACREHVLRFPGDRERIRWHASQAALDMLRRYFIYARHNKPSWPTVVQS